MEFYSQTVMQCNIVMLWCQTPERRSRSRPGSLVLLSDPPPAFAHKERSRTADCPKVMSTAVSQATALKAKGTCVSCVMGLVNSWLLCAEVTNRWHMANPWYREVLSRKLFPFYLYLKAARWRELLVCTEFSVNDVHTHKECMLAFCRTNIQFIM